MRTHTWLIRTPLLLGLALALSSCSGHNPSEADSPATADLASLDAPATTDLAPPAETDVPKAVDAATEQPSAATIDPIAALEQNIEPVAPVKHRVKHRLAHKLAKAPVTQALPIAAPVAAPVAPQEQTASMTQTPQAIAPDAETAPAAQSAPQAIATAPVAAVTEPANKKDRQPTNVDTHQEEADKAAQESKISYTYGAAGAIGLLLASGGFWYYRKRKAA